jgi:hypothetical protein
MHVTEDRLFTEGAIHVTDIWGLNMHVTDLWGLDMHVSEDRGWHLFLYVSRQQP